MNLLLCRFSLKAKLAMVDSHWTTLLTTKELAKVRPDPISLQFLISPCLARPLQAAVGPPPESNEKALRE